MHIVNRGNFRKHLMRSWHMSRGRAPEDVHFVIKESSCRNMKKYGKKRTTNFLLPSTLGSPSYCDPIELNEIVSMVKRTIRYGRKCPNSQGHTEAIHTFSECIGVLCTFKNGTDETSGYQIKELNKIKVVYDVLQKNLIRLITAFPL